VQSDGFAAACAGRQHQGFEPAVTYGFSTQFFLLEFVLQEFELAGFYGLPLSEAFAAARGRYHQRETANEACEEGWHGERFVRFDSSSSFRYQQADNREFSPAWATYLI
jgi:hypothetical protein